MALPHHPFIDVEDYLLLDTNSKNARYEFLDGELYMQAGGSNDHSVIAVNFTTILNQAAKGTLCRVFNSDVRLKLSETRYVHPDIAVSCDQRDIEQEDMISHPSLVAEVHSPTTEMIDRIKKSVYYRECESIQEYLIIDSRSISIEYYQREGDAWKIRTYRAGSSIRLACFDLQFPIEELYDKTRVTN